MSREDAIAQLAEKFKRQCKHFIGVVRGGCRAGVDVLAVLQPGLPLPERFPCTSPSTPGCDKREVNSEAEATAIAAELVDASALMMDRLAAQQCPSCGVPMTGTRRVGRCDYAEPCGHRLGQAL